MALNFTTSYTFSPNTTISSSQVNTNFSDIAGVFQGLEAETKSLAKLKVDIDPTLALEVATKQYVDHYSTYRRPVLQYSSASVVNLETGINGTSGQAQILFPDGNLRTDSTATRINLDLTRVAALTGTAQSGLQTGTVSNNTWYAVYAVKTTDNTSNFVTVADKTNFPVQASFSTINTNFGTNSWVYLGLVRYGDNSGTANAVVTFGQSGNFTHFYNTTTGNAFASSGIRMATTASATSVTYTYSAGNGAAQIPSYILLVLFRGGAGGGSGLTQLVDAAGAKNYWLTVGTTGVVTSSIWFQAGDGAKVLNSSAVPMDIFMDGFIDPVLGVGSNPQL